jgi:hypothetical protein
VGVQLQLPERRDVDGGAAVQRRAGRPARRRRARPAPSPGRPRARRAARRPGR